MTNITFSLLNESFKKNLNELPWILNKYNDYSIINYNHSKFHKQIFQRNENSVVINSKFEPNLNILRNITLHEVIRRHCKLQR